MKTLFTTSLLLILLCETILGQQVNPLISKDDFAQQKKWADSIYDNMTLEERIGQLFMVDIFSSDPRTKINKVKTLIRDHHIGGVIFSKGGPMRQAKLTNEFQELAKVPLMVGMDAEWGLAMRLDSTFAYPWNMTLGAITDNRIIRKVGRRIGYHCRRLGVNINFAPVVDINTNPRNPIIGNRSFGEDRDNVTAKSLAFMKGMQDAGVLANAKHFPGHGDTESDSHKTLPTIQFDRERIDSVELYPYRQLIQEGLSSVMVAHLNIPALEDRPGYPSSISESVVTELLKKELGFNGLIFTDALNMKGASNFKEPGEIDLAAFLAGNDVLLISEDVPRAIERIAAAFKEGLITEERLAHSVRKILYAKYKAGLNNYCPVETHYLYQDLNSVNDRALLEEAVDHSLTVLKNERAILPIKNLDKQKIAYIHFGDDDGTPFFKELNKYAQVDWVKASSLPEYIEKLKSYNYVIAGFHKSNASPWKSFRFKNKELVWLYEIARTNTLILDIFASPYALLDLKTQKNFDGILLSYQNSEIAQSLSAQLLFGAREANGRLPVSLGSEFPINTHFKTRSIRRLSYGTPESVGMNSYTLAKIDSLVNAGLEEEMMPGAQVLVARRGKVVYNKSFGYHTQQKSIPVKTDDIYDLASLTKILATLPLIIELTDQGVIGLDSTLGELLPEFSGSDKEDITLKYMLSHYARLKAWIPFYVSTLDPETKAPSSQYYASGRSEEYPFQVANKMFMRFDYRDSIYDQIRNSPLRRRRGYKYSDLPYYLLKKYLEDNYGKGLEQIVQERLYRPMGAYLTTYRPTEKFDLDRIPPTEEDDYFRMQRVQGFVHDQGAAMLNGVSGHAGLFSNANDVAKIMQMYLWKGFYGGKRFFKPETVDLFNNCYFCDRNVRRGVGFDKPQLGDVGPTCGCVSMTSFGHSGFTGTFTWADPEQEIVYVFLSNRTYPSADNRKLIKSSLRSNIQEVIYQAIDYR